MASAAEQKTAFPPHDMEVRYLLRLKLSPVCIAARQSATTTLFVGRHSVVLRCIIQRSVTQKKNVTGGWWTLVDSLFGLQRGRRVDHCSKTFSLCIPPSTLTPSTPPPAPPAPPQTLVYTAALVPFLSAALLQPFCLLFPEQIVGCTNALQTDRPTLSARARHGTEVLLL